MPWEYLVWQNGASEMHKMPSYFRVGASNTVLTTAITVCIPALDVNMRALRRMASSVVMSTIYFTSIFVDVNFKTRHSRQNTWNISRLRENWERKSGYVIKKTLRHSNEDVRHVYP